MTLTSKDILKTIKLQKNIKDVDANDMLQDKAVIAVVDDTGNPVSFIISSGVVDNFINVTALCSLGTGVQSLLNFFIPGYKYTQKEIAVENNSESVEDTEDTQFFVVRRGRKKKNVLPL